MYASKGSYFFLPPKLDWEEQIVLITGGQSLRPPSARLLAADKPGGSGIGALLAETLAIRGVTVVVLTKYPPQQPFESDNLHTYICDVSIREDVHAIADSTLR